MLIKKGVRLKVIESLNIDDFFPLAELRTRLEILVCSLLELSVHL